MDIILGIMGIIEFLIGMVIVLAIILIPAYFVVVILCFGGDPLFFRKEPLWLITSRGKIHKVRQYPHMTAYQEPLLRSELVYLQQDGSVRGGDSTYVQWALSEEAAHEKARALIATRYR